MNSRCTRTYGGVGHARQCDLTITGFACPLAEPDVHLSLCIRLSRNNCEVCRPHPAAAIALYLQPAHLILRITTGVPDPISGPNRASALMPQQGGNSGFRILLP